jgi:hypothetical protein
MLAGKISALKYFPNCFWDSVGSVSQLTAGRVIVYKNRSEEERGDPKIIPPLHKKLANT